MLAGAPTPTFGVWLAHFVALETVWASFVLAVIGLFLAWPYRLRWFFLATLPVSVTAIVWPVLAARRDGVSLSWVEYASGPTVDASVVVERDVSLTPELTVDLYRPATAGRVPLVVVVHGGSFWAGDKGENAHVSRALAAGGRLVADLRYRLAPKAPFPAAVGDVKCAVGLLRARADVEPDRVALLGRSAGGQIALLAAYSPGEPTLPPSCAVEDRPVSAVVGLYSIVDLKLHRDERPWGDPIDAARAVDAYLGGASPAGPDVFERADPATYAQRAWVPTLLVHGAWDRLVSVEHSRRLAAVQRAAGRAVELVELPLADHAFDHRAGGAADQHARGLIEGFLARQGLGR